MIARYRPTSARVTDSVESRLAARLAAGLTLASLELPHDVAERLRAGREQALAAGQRARAAQVSLAPAGAQLSRGAVLAGGGYGALTPGGGGAPWWQRAMALAPLVALVFGLVLINRQAEFEQVSAAAEIDSQILADDLPPAAYADPGFAEYLRTGGDGAE